MVVVLGLALLSEVAVGLDAVLEAVQLGAVLANSRNGGQTPAVAPSISRIERSGGEQCVFPSQTYLPA